MAFFMLNLMSEKMSTLQICIDFEATHKNHITYIIKNYTRILDSLYSTLVWFPVSIFTQYFSVPKFIHANKGQNIFQVSK